MQPCFKRALKANTQSVLQRWQSTQQSSIKFPRKIPTKNATIHLYTDDVEEQAMKQVYALANSSILCFSSFVCTFLSFFYYFFANLRKKIQAKKKNQKNQKSKIKIKRYSIRLCCNNAGCALG